MKRSIFSRMGAWLLILVGLTWVTTHLTACNTVEGAGEDIQGAGEGISDTANDMKD